MKLVRKTEKGFYKLSNIKLPKGIEIRNIKRRTITREIDPLDTMNRKYIYMGDAYHKGKKITNLAVTSNNQSEFIWWAKKNSKVKKILKNK